MYWQMPSTVSGTRLAAPANSSSGTAVTTPQQTSSTEVSTGPCPKTACPFVSDHTRYAMAGMKSTAVSIVMPSTAGAPTSFLIRPYPPKLNASTSASQGGRP